MKRADQTINQYLRQCVSAKWPEDKDKEWWYTKFAAVRRRKLQFLFDQQEGKCFYCEDTCWMTVEDTQPRQMRRHRATLEHLLPQTLGGFDNIANLRMACDFCNAMRGAIPDWQEFKRLRMDAGKDLREASKKLRLWLFNKPGRTSHFVKNKETRKLRTSIAVYNLAVLWITFPKFFEEFKPAIDELKEKNWL